MCRLLNEHTIAEAEKAVFQLHRLPIRRHHLFFVVKSGDEHEQRALGQMEVGDQGVHGFEAVAGVDEDPRVTAQGRDVSVLVGHALDRAAGGRAHADDPSAGDFTFVDDARALGGNREKLGVHDVVGDLFLLDGTEGSKPHMEHHGRDPNALFADAVEQRGGEMQSRRGSGRRALLARVDRLVAVTVGKALGDVGRQGHHADLLQDIVNTGIRLVIVGKANDAVALFDDVGHRGTQDAAAEDQLHTDTRTLPGLDQGLPGIQLMLTQEQQLDLCLLAPCHVSVKTGGDDLGIIDDQHVAGVEIVDNIVKMAVRHRSRAPIEHHQARMVARFHRMLRDALLGEVIIKIRRRKRRFGHLVDDHIFHLLRVLFRKNSHRDGMRHILTVCPFFIIHHFRCKCNCFLQFIRPRRHAARCEKGVSFLL